jgi:hypothetical protein
MNMSRYITVHRENTLTLLGAFLDHVGRDEDIVSYSMFALQRPPIERVANSPIVTARDISEKYWKVCAGA